MSRITNKHKQAKASDFDCTKNPASDIKKMANRLIRREPVESDFVRTHSQTDNKANRKKPGNCPVCKSSLDKNSKDTRYLRVCGNCKSRYDKGLKCSRCSTNRIWSGPKGAFCKGCGNEYET